MTRYVALIDRTADAFGAAFPDLPGCTAMGKTMDEAMRNAVKAVVEWIEHSKSENLDIPGPRGIDELMKDLEVSEQLREGAAFVYVPAIIESGKTLRANISIDSGLLELIDEEAEHVGLTRSAFLASAAREKIMKNA